MTWLPRLASLFRNLFRKQLAEQSLDDEVESLLALLTAEKIKEGIAPLEAARAARIELGGSEQLKEQVRSARAGAWLEVFLRDVHYGLRTLRKNPGFTVVAVLTLALGIGATTAIFSFLNAWLIQPLPYPHPETLMVLSSHNEKQGWTSHGVTSTADFLDLQKRSTSFEQIVGWVQRDFSVTRGGPPVLIEGGQ